MITVFEAIQQRRSIRSFRSDPVPQEAVLQIIEAARLAPSGSNRQPWRFLVVTGAEERRALREMSFKQAFIEEAPVVFVCCADLSAYSLSSVKQRRQEFEEYGVMQTLSGELAEPQYWDDVLSRSQKDTLESNLAAARANVFIAVEHMALAAAALGLGTCWTGAIDSAAVKKYFNLGQNLAVLVLLPCGYPVRVPPPRPRLSVGEILLRPVNEQGK